MKKKTKTKVIPFYYLTYLTGEYLIISESILNSVSILSSCILNNTGFFTHWENESVTAEIIVTWQTFSTRSNCLYIHVTITQKSS